MAVFVPCDHYPAEGPLPFYYLNAVKRVQVRQETERRLVNWNELKLSMKRKKAK